MFMLKTTLTRVVCSVQVIFMLLGAAGCVPKENVSTSHDGGKSASISTEVTIATTENTSDPATQETVVSNESAPAEPEAITSPTVPEGTENTDPSSTERAPTVEATEATGPVVMEHTHNYTASVVSPGCETWGYTTHKCSCGANYTDASTAPIGHSYTDKVIEPTTEQGGWTEHTCSRCGHSYKDTLVDKLPSETEPAAEPVTEHEVAMAVVRYINQFRAEQGSTQLVYLPGMSQVAQYRSRQLVSNFSHDEHAFRDATAYYQYGRFIDMTEYGYDESYSYYDPDCNEAIGQGFYSGGVDKIGYNIANGCKGSAGHWRYVGSSEYSYIGVGCTNTGGYWYICIMVGRVNYG